jgi:hypothetical protein
MHLHIDKMASKDGERNSSALQSKQGTLESEEKERPTIVPNIVITNLSPKKS